MASTVGSSGDRTLNKVAFCSAVVAGAAYVSYKYLVSKKAKSHADGRSVAERRKNNRIYLRRLSGSELTAGAAAAAFALNATSNGDANHGSENGSRCQPETAHNGGSERTSSSSGRQLFFRPFSVQERIRELNVRARHFAETVLAVHLHDAAASAGSAGNGGGTSSSLASPGDVAQGMISHTQSLQPSPTHGGLAKSFPAACYPDSRMPIEITALGSSRCSSTENLHAAVSNGGNGNRPPGLSSCMSLPRLTSPDSTVSSPFQELRRTHSRRSIRSSGGQRSRRRSEAVEDTDDEDIDIIEAGHVWMLEERQAELQKRLREFESGPAIVLTPYESKSLVALLHTDDCDTLVRAIVAVANSCAFSANQERLRESGCLTRLESLVLHHDPRVKTQSLRAVGNLALNVDNQKLMMRTVVNVLSLLDSTTPLSQDDNGTDMIVQVLQTLTNVAALNDWHELYSNYVPRIWNLLVSSGHGPIRVQCLRLLTNLSTNDQMTDQVLTPQVPFGFWSLIDMKTPEEVLVRAISLVANLMASDQKKSIMMISNQNQNNHQATSSDFTDTEDFNHTNRQMLDLRRYGLLQEALSPTLTRLAKLMLSHPHEDVRTKARNVLNLIKGHQ